MTLHSGLRSGVGDATAFRARRSSIPGPTPQAGDAAASAAWRARQSANRLIPTGPRVPARGAPPPLRSRAGTIVEWPEEFGMLRNRARHFQSVAEQHGVRIRVRAANMDSLQGVAAGHPPKHVKLKSKTINELDELIGAPTGVRGQVGYFEPRLPPRGTMNDATWARVQKRYNQRLKEFGDQQHAMQSLVDRGLVRIDNGVVVDTGLSNTRLVDGELVSRGGPPGGTGKGFTGDHDMWDITRPDGSPLDARTRALVEEDLMNGVAETQHGPHKAWVPQTDVDRGIDAAIRQGHGGQRLPDGGVGPADLGGGRQAEGLIDFTPGQRPTVSYELGDGR